MTEFFRGWRRKIGLLTLVMACVFMAGWVRGFIVEDVWQPATGTVRDNFHEDTTQNVFRSSYFGITWQRGERLAGGKFGWQPGWGTNSPSNAAKIEAKINGDIKWRWRWSGFDFCCSEKGDSRYLRWRIPYWAIVIPLTLISAYLLLSKPRNSTPIKITEPIPADGA